MTAINPHLDAAPASAWPEAVRLVEAGEFFACHEVLERVWLKLEGPRREFYHGVILIAAALHKAHIQGRPEVAGRIYQRALGHLASLPELYHGVNVRELERRAGAALVDPGRPLRIPHHAESAIQA